MNAVVKTKHYLQAITDEIRHDLQRKYIREGDDLVVIVDPEDLIRYVNESTGQDLAQYVSDAISDAKDKDREKYIKLLSALLRGAITLEQQHEMNELLQSIVQDYAVADLNRRVELALRPTEVRP